MLAKRYGANALRAWQTRREAVRAAAAAYDESCMQGPLKPVYRFGDDLGNEDQIALDAHSLRLPGIAGAVNLDLPNRYEDMV